MLGVVLAGGAGRRIGGDKATVALAGRPLIAYPLAALAAVCDEVAVIAKRDTALPPLLDRADIWLEPDEPRHPLCGIVEALRRAGGRELLAVAADLPLVRPETLEAVLAAAQPGDLAVVPRAGGRLQPLCALYGRAALRPLERFAAGARATDVVAALPPRIVDVDDDDAFFNVNAPEDLLTAQVLLDGRG